MVEKFPTEEEIAAALACYSGDLYNMADVMDFLNITDIFKPNTTRLIAWLVSLHLIRPDRVHWITEIKQLTHYYQRCLERFFDEETLKKPLFTTKPEQGEPIEQTITEVYPWFEKFALCCGIDERFISEAPFRVKRILATLCHDVPKFKYSPIYKYIGYISYLIPLSYVQKGSLPISFAEGVGYHLTRSIISLVSFHKNLDDRGISEDHKTELIRIFKRFDHKTYDLMVNAKINILEFSLVWERTLFVELHAPLNVLLIWDNLFFHSHDYRNYVRYLLVAHFRQMGRAKIDFTSDESIDNMMWDATEIVEDTDKLIHDDKVSEKEIYMQMFCPCYQFMQFFKQPLFGWRRK
ncbi:hypothetical protein GPJ56_006231 [Histomonas meleagridis]|uniref:uncharacterized protein n=1 Tax=Histomonas meleagridis TaxID=135588 RepID=UPI00355AC18F|nr:hypothetical protein GPJ56_006231 [Histomonas meleagridis]KAH0796953.1 hypothetical protein GO595_010846 [Histomonas meleagridis]